MATGFVQRWKGKIALPVGGLWIGGVQLSGSGADFNTNTGWGVASTYSSTQTLPNGGVSQITSTVIAVYTIGPPVVGRTAVVTASTGSTAWMVKTAPAVVLGSPSVNGGTTLTNTIKSTSSLVATSVELIGLSTNAWLFMGAAPSTLSHLLFSTAT